MSNKVGGVKLAAPSNQSGEPLAPGTGANAHMSRSRQTILLIGLILAVAMTTIDQTIVALAAQDMQSGLGLSATGVTWAVDIYLLAAAAIFPLAGRIADIRGYRATMLVGILVFAIGSVACGLTPTSSAAATWIIAARAIQGVGSALMFPAAIGLLVGSTSKERRARSMALFFAISGAMTAVGPIAGSALIPVSWRLIFYINVPFALVSIVLVAVCAPHVAANHQRESLDLLGGSLIAATLTALVVPLQQGASWGWTSPWTLASFALALLFGIAFVLVERRTAYPVIKIAVFKTKPFTLSTLASLVASVVFIPFMFFASVYAQLALQKSVINASLLILQFFIGFMVAAQIGARVFERRGIRAVVLASGILGVFAFGALATKVTSLSAAGGSAWSNSLTWPIILAGASIGLMFSPAATDMVNRAIGASYGEVTAITQTMKNLGGALGMAILSVVASHRFTSELTTGLHPYGVTHAMAAKIASTVTSGSGAAAENISAVPAEVQQKIMDVVRQSYAMAMHNVFLSMGIAMAIMIIIAVFYPKRQHSTERG